jgi:glycosyltransferase involved in cell wall biosynthesis
MTACCPEPADRLTPTAVSVVIPVFNTAPYLHRCLDSLRGQSLQDLEIICVDDASTDNSPGIMSEYVGKDSRISVITMPENRGAAWARNAGIAVAQGTYLGFVDSDDAVDTDFYEKLYAKALESGADIVKGNRIFLDSEGQRHEEYINDKVRENKYHFTHQHTTAIYLRKMLHEHKILYQTGLINHEDIVFLTRAVNLARNVQVTDDTSYIRIFRTGSASDLHFNKKNKYSSMLSAREMIIEYINSIELNENDYLLLFSHQLDKIIPICKILMDNDALKSAYDIMIKLYNTCKYKMHMKNYSINCILLYKFAMNINCISSTTYRQYKNEDFDIFYNPLIRKKLEHYINSCKKIRQRMITYKI